MPDDVLTDAVFASAPYNTRGERKLRNADDGIYGQSGGQMLLAANNVAPGFEAAFDVALDLT